MTRLNQNRLLFVCPTSSPIGGLQTWLDQLSLGLEGRGWDPIVTLVHGPTTHDSNAYKAAHPDLQFTTIDGTSLTMAARVREVMRTIQRTRPDFYIPLTVIDAHDAVCHLKMNGSYQGRYILSLHGNLPQQIADATLFQPFADLSINPGALTCELVHWSGMPKSHVFHAPNATLPHPLREPSDPGTPIRLAYVGRLTDEDKRVMDLIGVVEMLEAASLDYRLDIVGSGPCERDLRDAIRSKSVRFHGFISADQLHQNHYPQWDILLSFSESEAFGISLIEAMSHGVVPVSSLFVGVRREGFLIDDQTALTFNIGDVQHCGRLIQELDQDRARLRSLARRAHQHVSATYTWERCVDKWESILQSVDQLETRTIPKVPPRKLEEGNSLAGRFSWLAPRLSDAYYKTKRSTLGIPECMKHGEEWPMQTRCFDELALSRIRAVTEQLDQASSPVDGSSADRPEVTSTDEAFR